jgi:site-specific DNA-methyltransferase (adenine-specific)
MEVAAKHELETFIGKIHHEDCVKGLRKVPDESVDLVFADPPFNIGYEYDEYDDRLNEDRYLSWCKEWIAEVKRVLKSDGAFWLAIGDEYAAELKVAAKQLGFVTRNWVVWYYTFGVHCHSKFTRSHAHIFYFTKTNKDVRFNFSEVSVFSARQLVYNDKRGNPKGRSPDDTWILRPQDCIDGFQPDEDTWYFPRVAGTFKERAGFHGCQMPEQLLGRIIRSCTDEQQVVVDPFSGSATTLVVAKKLNRRFFGFELSKEYVGRGSERLAAINIGDSLEGAVEPRVSAPGSFESIKNVKIVEPTAIEAELNEHSQGLIEALKNTHRGYSVDRVVADPILNEDFQNACDRLKLGGSPVERNRFLFRLRKTGRIKRAGVFTEKETKLDWKRMDMFLHASEIAWKETSDLYDASLDDILCDPRLASEFDRIASRFAPDFTLLEYRWGALKLRKQASQARSDARRNIAQNLKSFTKRKSVSFSDFDFTDISCSEGVYMVTSSATAKKVVYVGETENLQRRLGSMKMSAGLEPWLKYASPNELRISFMPTTLGTRTSSQAAILAFTHGSLLNIDDLGSAA